LTLCKQCWCYNAYCQAASHPYLSFMADSTASVCPKYHRAVELIGRRWTGAIVNVLLQGRRRFNEITTLIPDISDRMLSERLRELEGEQILSRIVVPET